MRRREAGIRGGVLTGTIHVEDAHACEETTLKGTRYIGTQGAMVQNSPSPFRKVELYIAAFYWRREPCECATPMLYLRLSGTLFSSITIIGIATI